MCELESFGRRFELPLELDVATFVDVGHGYARDASHVVMNGDVIEGADPGAFTVLAGGFAKDSHAVYRDGAIAEEPDSGPWDLASFLAFGRRYVADRRGVFCVRYGYDAYEVTEVEGASASDFEEIGLTFGRAPRAGVIFNNGVRDDTLDGATFELRGPWFAIDRHAVHHLRYGGKHTDDVGLVRIDADPSSFVVLGAHYAADSRSVFYYLNDAGDADLGVSWKLEAVAPAELELLEAVDPAYVRAGSAIFNHGTIEPRIADARGFEALGHGFARDGVHVYRLRRELREVDGTTRYSVEVKAPIVLDGVSPEGFIVEGPNRARAVDREIVFDDDE